jgi:acyl carrier protein
MITRLRISADRLETADSATPLLGMGIGLDSMEAMSLALEIEEAFGIVVQDEDLTERLFASFDTLTDYIIKQGGEENA